MILIFAGCGEVNPYTGRSQTILFSESKEIEIGEEQYKEMLEDPKLEISKDPDETLPFHRVFGKIVDAAKNSKFGERARKLNWEITVVKDDSEIQGHSFPGGKVIFYTGILSISKSDIDLALPIASLVASVLARHSIERVSKDLVAQIGAASAASYGVVHEEDLKGRKKQVLEADYIGLLLAAGAGYDPTNSIEVLKLIGFGGQDRYEAIIVHLDEARKIYRETI